MLKKFKKNSEINPLLIILGVVAALFLLGAMALLSKTDTPADLMLYSLTVSRLTISPPVYDDIRTPVSSVALLGLRNPSWQKFRDNGSTQGVYLLEFSNAALVNQEEVLYTMQLPHRYKEGTGIDMHMHITQRINESCVVVFLNECTWLNVNESAAPTTVQKAQYTFGAADAYKHGYFNFGLLNGTGKKISSQLICRLERESADSHDTCTNGVMLIELDGHYQQDTLGSYLEASKG